MNTDDLIDSGRRKFFNTTLGLALFAATATPARAQISKWFSNRPEVVSESVIPGSERVGSPLTILSYSNGTPYAFEDDNRFKLIYFGTSYRIPSCSVDLLIFQDAMKKLAESCGGDVTEHVAAFFIHPAHDDKFGPPSNLTGRIEIEGSHIEALHGDAAHVLDLARKHGARFETGSDGRVLSHTRFMYLMDPDGDNVAIFKPETFPHIIGQQILFNMEDEGLISNDVKNDCQPGW